jgi:hypothetical protein
MKVRPIRYLLSDHNNVYFNEWNLFGKIIFFPAWVLGWIFIPVYWLFEITLEAIVKAASKRRAK